MTIPFQGGFRDAPPGGRAARTTDPDAKGEYAVMRRQRQDGPPRSRADASNFNFASLLFVVIIRQNQPFRRWRRHLALFLLLTYLSTSLLSMPVSSLRSPTGTALWAAFRSVSAQKAPFSLPASKNLASAVATQEL